MNRLLDNLEGQKFGDWIVVKKIKPNSYGNTYWLVKCVCGKEREITGRSLRYYGSTNCGCRRTKKLTKHPTTRGANIGPRTKDETGNIYGRLIVIKPTKQNVKKEWYWLCKCTCGNLTEVRGSHLRRGAVQSCGCGISDAHKIIDGGHGKTYTKAYTNARNKRRKHKVLQYDKWSVEMELLLREMFPACVLCGMTEEEHLEKFGTSLHVDHVRPLSRGNGLKPGNATILCAKCNREKHNTPLRKLDKATQNTLLKTANEFKEKWES